MQEQLLARARAAGAEVHRGVALGDLRTGDRSELDFVEGGRQRTLNVRLVIGADGREFATTLRNLGLT